MSVQVKPRSRAIVVVECFAVIAFTGLVAVLLRRLVMAISTPATAVVATAGALLGYLAIHHSSRSMDWLAGSRLHLLDIVVTRGLSFVPLYVFGFAPAAIYAYLVFVSFHAVFIHANVRWNLRAIDRVLVTPRFHHWHHAAHPEAVNRNFAVHAPWIDRLLGTAHLPVGQWPQVYGIAGDPVPEGYFHQLVWPVIRRA